MVAIEQPNAYPAPDFTGAAPGQSPDPTPAHEVNSAASRTGAFPDLHAPWWWSYIRPWRVRMWLETGRWS